ncbi:DUF7576 family protein [Halorussus litoreus]|uniref:DUF7576 family protein n=1 Tax=Halorussus litoreus TaxID=1710536 RepID=UPI000E268387|nr:hypothetical protein [Halorussus litoreus]
MGTGDSDRFGARRSVLVGQDDGLPSERDGPRSERNGLRSEHESVNRQCSYCGEDVPAEEWHPVATVRDADGDIDIHAFCNEACRSAWERERE